MLDSKRHVLRQAPFLVSALVVGLLSVGYAELIGFVQKRYFGFFHEWPIAVSFASPLFFVLATYLVRRFAPDAKGSGIPQVLEAIHLTEEPSAKGTFATNERIRAVISPKTAFVKILSTSSAILGGASVGREGPTVQIAASTFGWIASKTGRILPRLDLQAYLVAGGAAGVAAAFNTPLAGITFALEEIGETKFPQFKENVMLAVVVGGIAAQALAGDYLYFGHPVLEKPAMSFLIGATTIDAVLIGLAGGLVGTLFAWILTQTWERRLPRYWLARAFVCGVICACINYATHGATAGSGYEVTRELMDSPTADFSGTFFLTKFVTTVLSYLSGMAGGIFSPSLSIGAGLGWTIATVAHLGNLKTCALLGMVAFFAGAVQAPLTAVIIVMEMTDQHELIIPLLVAAYLAQGVAKRFMPVSLYRVLAFGRDAKTHG